MTELELTQDLRSLGFRASSEAISAVLRRAIKENLGPAKALEDLAQVEKRERSSRNLARRLHDAAIGPTPPIDDFDWLHPKTIDRALFTDLLSVNFIREKQNVLLRGPSGVGKTTLAKHLAHAAIQAGMSVRMTSVSAALADLMKQESVPATQRRIRFYTRPHLLILDELGYVPCDSHAADMIFNVITERHEKASTIITTNLSFSQWGPFFDNAPSVGAMVDRFTQYCHVLDIDAESWRQKTSLRVAAANSRPKSAR